MHDHLIGHWESANSTIPAYQAEEEWLEFSIVGGTWTTIQTDGSKQKHETLFHWKETENGIHLTPFNKITGQATQGWHLRIERHNANEIAVTPPHGFTTIFRRTESFSVHPANTRAKASQL